MFVAPHLISVLIIEGVARKGAACLEEAEKSHSNTKLFYFNQFKSFTKFPQLHVSAVCLIKEPLMLFSYGKVRSWCYCSKLHVPAYTVVGFGLWGTCNISSGNSPWRLACRIACRSCPTLSVCAVCSMT